MSFARVVAEEAIVFDGEAIVGSEDAPLATITDGVASVPNRKAKEYGYANEISNITYPDIQSITNKLTRHTEVEIARGFRITDFSFDLSSVKEELIAISGARSVARQSDATPVRPAMYMVILTFNNDGGIEGRYVMYVQGIFHHSFIQSDATPGAGGSRMRMSPDICGYWSVDISDELTDVSDFETIAGTGDDQIRSALGYADVWKGDRWVNGTKVTGVAARQMGINSALFANPEGL